MLLTTHNNPSEIASATAREKDSECEGQTKSTCFRMSLCTLLLKPCICSQELCGIDAMLLSSFMSGPSPYTSRDIFELIEQASIRLFTPFSGTSRETNMARKCPESSNAGIFFVGEGFS